MIQDKKTVIQIMKEFSSDKKEIMEYLQTKGTARFKRDVLSATKYPYFAMPIQYTTSNGHKYLILAIARKRSDWKKLDCYPHRVYKNKVYTLDSFDGMVDVHPTHVFLRYRERFLKKNDIPIIDVIKLYFKRNPIFYFKANNDGHFMATCQDGVVFGIAKDGFRIIKTFISNEMMYEKQKKLSVFLEKLRQEEWKKLA